MSERRFRFGAAALAGAAVLSLAFVFSGAALAQAAAAPAASAPNGVGPRQPANASALRLTVFTFRHQRASEAFAIVRGMLSRQGSVALDEGANTLAVRDDAMALGRIARAVAAIDHTQQPVRIEVQLIRAEAAKVSPAMPSTSISSDLLTRLRGLFRYDTYALLSRSLIDAREGEVVTYEMVEGYRLAFRPGTLVGGGRLRLAGFEIVRARPGSAQRELVRTTVNLLLDQPLILGLATDESSDHALLLALRYDSASNPSQAPAGPPGPARE